MAGNSETSTDPAQLFDAVNALQRQAWQAWTGPTGDAAPADPAAIIAAAMAYAARQQLVWTRWWLDRLDLVGSAATAASPAESAALEPSFERLSGDWLELQQRLAGAWLDALTAHPSAGWTAPFALTRGMLDGLREIQREWQEQGHWTRLWQAGEIRRVLPDKEPPPEAEALEDMAKAAAVDARRQRRDATSG